MGDDEPEFQRAADAVHDLRQRDVALKKLWLFTPVAVALVLGGVGALAHVTGHWALFGVDTKGYYRIHAFTIALAFGLPGAPLIGLAYGAYRVMRARMFARWLTESQQRWSLPRELLEERAAFLFR